MIRRHRRCRRRCRRRCHRRCRRCCRRRRCHHRRRRCCCFLQEFHLILSIFSIEACTNLLRALFSPLGSSATKLNCSSLLPNHNYFTNILTLHFFADSSIFNFNRDVLTGPDSIGTI